jgi:hypothetical protein
VTDNVHSLEQHATQTHQIELGVETAQRVATTLYDDFLPELRGRNAIRTWKEMSTNDSTVAAILYAITALAREVDWKVVPRDDTPQAQTAADFLQDTIDGMKHPLSETIGEAFTALTYGFSFHEIVYNNVDGRIGWERLSYRPQDTLIRWELDDKLRPVAFLQEMPEGQKVVIPVDGKGILFRPDSTTPSGTPILRGAWRSWVFKKRAEEHLMISSARNLVGMPQVQMPAEVLAAGQGDPFYDAMKSLVTRVKRDDLMGIMMPSDRDEAGNLLYEFSLVSPEANPNFDQVVGVIRMFAADITSVVLAGFIGLGRDSMGSRALAEPQQELFQTALGSLLDILENTLNRQAVAWLFKLNPHVANLPIPRLAHGEIKDVDMLGLADLLLKTAQAGAVWFNGEEDDPVLRQIAELAGLDTDNAVQ